MDKGGVKKITILAIIVLMVVGVSVILFSRNNVNEIRVIEVDLSVPNLHGTLWHERGGTVEPRVDLTQILGQPITTRDEAIDIANKILEAKSNPEMEIGQELIDGLTLELMSVEHDPAQNIWIFGYGDSGPDPGSSFHVALDGNTGELLRMWVN